jgi:hypothetical protein
LPPEYADSASAGPRFCTDSTALIGIFKRSA